MAGRPATASLVIASGQTATTTPLDRAQLKASLAVFIGGPSALTGTVTVQVKLRGDNTFRTLQDGGSDVTVSALKVTRVDLTEAFDSLQVLSGSAEAATRTFPITIMEE